MKFQLAGEGHQYGTDGCTIRARRPLRRGQGRHRLALLLNKHPEGRNPNTYTLLPLLCFHAARFPRRMDDDGGLIQLEMQDRSKSDWDLTGRGFRYLEKASMGNELSEYHL